MNGAQKKQPHRHIQDADSTTQNLLPTSNRYARWKIRPRFPCSSKSLDYPAYKVPIPYHIKNRPEYTKDHMPEIWSKGKKLILPSVETPRVHYDKSTTHRLFFIQQDIKKGGTRHPAVQLPAVGIVPYLF